jgi:hypothetical protein
MDQLRLLAGHQFFWQNVFPLSQRGGFPLTAHIFEAANEIWHLSKLSHPENHMKDLLKNIIHGREVL